MRGDAILTSSTKIRGTINHTSSKIQKSKNHPIHDPSPLPPHRSPITQMGATLPVLQRAVHAGTTIMADFRRGLRLRPRVELRLRLRLVRLRLRLRTEAEAEAEAKAEG